MSKSRHPDIRKLLRKYHDGLTSLEISEWLDLKPDSVRNALREMPDTYIDRWKLVAQEPPHAVWCAIVPPEDCPKPKVKNAKNKISNPFLHTK